MLSMNQKEYWKTEWNKREAGSENNFARRIFSLIKSNHKKLLDLGCGDGRDSIYFAKKGLNVTSVDFSESGIKKLNEKIKRLGIKNINAVRADIKKINFKDNSFDIIYAHLSLHYFDDKTTGKIFNNLYNILNFGGLIFIKCKSTEDSLCGQGEKVGEDMYFKNHLHHFFSKDYMKEKLGKFKILRIRKTS